ncbi:uncharacterized protein [Littorina saxatilis]|uniref:Secreted protein n=1 Tax=Littorina saxatilis TaxID=31220 RepID=A0AAN9GHM2_9CAEN
MRATQTLLFLGLLASCCRHVLGGENCKFSNKGGRLATFFTKANNIATFPCSYKLAELRCGNLQAEVTFTNRMKDGDLYISEVKVDITAFNEDGDKRYRRINSISESRWDDYKSGEAWKWENKGSKPDAARKVTPGYDRERKSYYIKMGELRVYFVLPDDALSVTCKNNSLVSAVKFPQTLCGSPTNTEEDLAALDVDLDSMNGTDLSMARLDYMQLVRQDVWQTEDMCVEARKLLKGKCSKKGENLYHCNRMYNPNQEHGKCLAKTFNAFKTYITCVTALCAKNNCADKKDCGVLGRVSDECSDKSGKEPEDFAKLAGCKKEPWLDPKCS